MPEPTPAPQPNLSLIYRRMEEIRALAEQAITDLTHAQIHLEQVKVRMWAIRDKLSGGKP